MAKIAVNRASIEQLVEDMKTASDNIQSRPLNPIDEASTIKAVGNGQSVFAEVQADNAAFASALNEVAVEIMNMANRMVALDNKAADSMFS